MVKKKVQTKEKNVGKRLQSEEKLVKKDKNILTVVRGRNKDNKEK